MNINLAEGFTDELNITAENIHEGLTRMHDSDPEDLDYLAETIKKRRDNDAHYLEGPLARLAIKLLMSP